MLYPVQLKPGGTSKPFAQEAALWSHNGNTTMHIIFEQMQLAENMFFLRVCFLVLLVMAWLTANEEIAEELNSPSCTCICWPFCLFDFNSFGGCSMKCGFIFFSTSSKLYIEDPGQKKANFSIFLCTVSWVWEKNHKYYGYFCFYLCSCTQLLFV